MNEEVILVQPTSNQQEVCYYRYLFYLYLFFCRTADVVNTIVHNLSICIATRDWPISTIKSIYSNSSLFICA